MYRLSRGFGGYSPGLYGLTQEMAAAIAQFEGFNTPGTVAQRDNNPGNLRSGPGQTGTDAGGYAIFPDVATGEAALENQINLNVARGLTLDQFFAGVPGGYPGYAPSTDSNNPAAYASFVSTQTGIPLGVPLNQLPSGSSDNAIPPAGGPMFGPPLINPDGTLQSSAPAPIATFSDDGSVPSATSGLDPLVLGGLVLGGIGLLLLAA